MSDYDVRAKRDGSAVKALVDAARETWPDDPFTMHLADALEAEHERAERMAEIVEAAKTYRVAVEEGPEQDGGIAIQVTYRSMVQALARLDEGEDDE